MSESIPEISKSSGVPEHSVRRYVNGFPELFEEDKKKVSGVWRFSEKAKNKVKRISELYKADKTRGREDVIRVITGEFEKNEESEPPSEFAPDSENIKSISITVELGTETMKTLREYLERIATALETERKKY